MTTTQTSKIEPNTFAEACYDQNSIAELEEALAGPVDEVDCKTWGIDADEWRRSIKLALDARKAEAMTADEARALGREHGALVPANPASGDQAWSDCRAAAEMRGASADARAHYAKGHMEGQRGK